MALSIEFEGLRTNSESLEWIVSTALWQAGSWSLMESVTICLRRTRPGSAVVGGAKTCFPTAAVSCKLSISHLSSEDLPILPAHNLLPDNLWGISLSI